MGRMISQNNGNQRHTIAPSDLLQNKTKIPFHCLYRYTVLELSSNRLKFFYETSFHENLKNVCKEFSGLNLYIYSYATLSKHISSSSVFHC